MQFILILFASFLGSLHCAGMCGGFAIACSQNDNPAESQLCYHFGRLIAYLSLGLVAISLGQIANKFGEQYGIHQIATYITGSLLIFAGLAMLFKLRVNALKIIPFRIVSPLRNQVGKLKSYSLLYPLSLGFFSSFLPCAWLYSYLAVAAGIGSISGGLLVMFFFWLGTLPILISLAGIAKLVSSPIKKHAPTVIAILMIVAGGYSLTLHVQSADHNSHCPMHSK